MPPPPLGLTHSPSLTTSSPLALALVVMMKSKELKTKIYSHAHSLILPHHQLLHPSTHQQLKVVAYGSAGRLVKQVQTFPKCVACKRLGANFVWTRARQIAMQNMLHLYPGVTFGLLVNTYQPISPGNLPPSDQCLCTRFAYTLVHALIGCHHACSIHLEQHTHHLTTELRPEQAEMWEALELGQAVCDYAGCVLVHAAKINVAKDGDILDTHKQISANNPSSEETFLHSTVFRECPRTTRLGLLCGTAIYGIPQVQTARSSPYTQH